MATQALELDADAFMRLVTEEHLQVEGPTAEHWLYTGRKGKDGWELYKTRTPPTGWIYQARRVNTQTAVGGGALYTQISVPAGTVGRLIEYQATSSGNATLVVYMADEDGANCTKLASIGAAAGNIVSLPSIGSAASATGNLVDSLGLLIAPSQTIYAATGNLVQNDTLTVYIKLLMSSNTSANWTTTGSAGTPSLAASTISTANTLQAVYL